MTPKKLGIVYLALLAAVISTLCDKVHVITNTLYYPKPVFDGQAWWNFPAFFLAFIIMGGSYNLLVKFLPASVDRSFSTSTTNAKNLIESLLLFALVYILSGFGNDSPMFLNILFYSTFLLRLAVTEDKAFLSIVSIFIGIGGTLGEGFLSSLDLVYYTKPVFYHVPAWLAGLYLHGTFALRDGMRFFVYRTN